MTLIINYLLIGTITMFLIDIANLFVAAIPQEINNRERTGFIVLWPIMIVVIIFTAIKEANKNK